MTLVSLPSEIWLYIYREATWYSSPLVAAHSEHMSHRLAWEPLPDPQHFLREMRSFVLVCRLWNRLANELLYENITVPVDARFSALHAALAQPEVAARVRTIRLSTSRLDYNVAILMLCARAQVIYQPDISPSLRAKDGAKEPILSAFSCLKHVYWTESFLTSPLLRLLLQAAPHLQHLFLTPSHAQKSSPQDQLDLPPIPTLRRLACPGFANRSVPYIFKLDLEHLTRLSCSPSHLILPDFPTLPALETLELFGTRQSIQFPVIFARCPSLRELFYDIFNLLEPPTALSREDALTRLHLYFRPNVLTDWGPVDEHLGALLAPQFPRIERVILEGMWKHVVDDTRFVRFRDGLRSKGSRIECPEGVEL
ncbi:hypothetical protein FB45DRAFT_907186 [Roridomyces roridus]|uniref:F-box domain-containing protein n=1 Tax=Roridomyces roridus TaxID=1738132 RepID=A0AAD7C1X1_9AGAR|nr:hypothetical protein FB45DRAFT_907186 [Roridomyces roridus]